MRIKTLAALLAASSLIMASPAVASAPGAAGALSVPASERASASLEEQSQILDSGFLGAAIVFGIGLVAGYLLHSVLNDDDDEEPASP